MKVIDVAAETESQKDPRNGFKRKCLYQLDPSEGTFDRERARKKGEEWTAWAFDDEAGDWVLVTLRRQDKRRYLDPARRALTPAVLLDMTAITLLIIAILVLFDKIVILL